MENRSSRSEVWRNKLTCATQIKTFFCLKKYDCTSINNRTYVLTRITDWKKKSLIASLNKIKLFFSIRRNIFFINKYVDWMFCQRKLFYDRIKKIGDAISSLFWNFEIYASKFSSNDDKVIFPAMSTTTHPSDRI